MVLSPKASVLGDILICCINKTWVISCILCYCSDLEEAQQLIQIS